MSIPPPISSPTTPRQRLASTSAFTPTQPRPCVSRNALSVQLFQERHTAEFAHLHDHEDDETRRLRLAMEQGRLEEERRIGREKRQSLMMGHQKTKSDARSAWRPLSLLQRQAGNTGHRRAQSQTTGSTSEPSSSRILPYLFSPTITQPRSTSDKHPSRGLDVVIEREPFPPPEETSFSHSTYSWATQFSGETSELRTTAHYVHPGEQEEEEMLDSPEKLEKRRKRIVAIAHTVRQLEGIGSREVEDPAVFDVIAKAWFDRSENVGESIIKPHDLLPAHLLPPTPELSGGLVPAPFVPDFPNGATVMNGHAALRRYPPQSTLSSPLDDQFRTPALSETSINEDDFTRRSRSMRYSYASSLHDLALDGGLKQGSKLMNEKAWLRSSTSGTPWGGDFDMPPLLRASISPPRSSTPPPPILKSPILLDRKPPERTLRKCKTTISHNRPAPIPAAPAEAGPSRGWGLGFVSTWWDTSPPAAAATTITTDIQQGFREGEDGKPRTWSRGRSPVHGSRTGCRTSSHSRRPSSTLSITSSPSPSPRREGLARVGSGDTSVTSSCPSPSRVPVLPRSAKNQDPMRPATSPTTMVMMTPPNPTVAMNRRLDYDRSSSLGSSRGTRTPAEREPAELLKSPRKILPYTKRTTREKPSTSNRPPRSQSSIILFFLGFVLPFLWIVGGWFISSPPAAIDIERGDVVRTSPERTGWTDSPDPWITRSRWATAIGLPVLGLGGIITIIVYFTLR